MAVAGAALAALEQACNGHVAQAGEEDAVVGVQPRWVVRPADTAEVAGAMRTAAENGLAVVVRGTGSKLSWGAAPERVDVVLDVSRLDQVVEHEWGDLVAVVGAGTRLDRLQEVLRRAGQRLGVDPTRAGTVGGTVATGATGPLRLRHGAVRDLVIGMTLVRPDGVVAHSGGKVVKNVAGYDLGKLLTGSFGTLAVVTEVAFRLHPVPAGRHWVVRSVASPGEAQAAAQALVHSQLMPAAIEVDWRWPEGEGSVGAQLEGHAEGARSCAAQAAQLLGAGATIADEPPGWWGTEPRAAESFATLCRLGFDVAGLGCVLDSMASVGTGTGVRTGLRGSAGVGTALLAIEGDAEQVVEAVTLLRVAAAAGYGGHLVVLEAPAPVRGGLDVWGPVRGLDLMRAVKDQFDPGRVLAPGRFVGGI